MNEATLPPSPNWYLSSILACANDGTVAWGSKNAIVIGKHVKNRKTLDYSIIPDAHLDKINSLAFSPQYGESGKNLLVSGGDEYIIRVWDLDTMTAVLSQSYTDTKQKVIGVDWSKSDPSLICCISIEGSLITWNTKYTGCQIISLGKITATCIACSPHKSNIIAIGTKSGLVYIINSQGNGNIIYKMRGHDVEITSLSWCPTDVNIFNGSNTKDLLLASGARDKSIFIWRAGGDGRYETRLKLPDNPMDSHQHRSKIGPSAGHFSVVSWLKPKYLLANSLYGELLCLDFSKQMKTPPWKCLHGNHMRGLFSIANVPMSHSELNENWRHSQTYKVWTAAQDRLLICSIIENDVCSTEYSIPTHAGFIYCIASCPLDTSRVAYGGGDALLRLWNLSEPHEKIFNTTIFWQKIMGRVTSIAWHPEEENVLAFGTSEGRVGIFDTNNINKPPILYRHHHRRTVYSLGWSKNSSSKNYNLYSCGDHELIHYQYEKPAVAPTVLIKKDCTEFCWKSDLSCIAIGFEDGSLSFLNDKHEPCGRPIFYLQQPIQCITWHPDSTTTDLMYSPLKNYLAVTTNTSIITIFDMTNMIDQMSKNLSKIDMNSVENINSKDDNTVQYKIVGTLMGHSARIVCLAWSPHLSGYLVSGSFDKTAQVWNVNTQELIGTYTGHCGPIYSCMWSPLDPDYIITGSIDFSLRIWRISEQKVILPSEKSTVKKNESKKNKKKDKKIATNLNIEKITTSIEKVSLSDGNNDNNLVQIKNNIENGGDNQKLIESHTETKKNKNKKGSYFCVHRKIMNDKEIVLESCLKMAKKVLNLQNDESITATNIEDNDDNKEIPTIFGSKEDISKIINIEYCAHVEHNQNMLATEMSIWNNNLRQQLLDAARDLRLNDFLVSLAPSLSVKLWQTMCESYATQLIQESNPTKAVCYLLCIHKIHRAIEVFIEEKMYKEAYILAKYKLEPDDSILNNILEEWAKAAMKSGHFEEAAQCYIQLGDINKAAKTLARRHDIRTLKTAAQLATLTNNSELNETILEQAVKESLLRSDYESCRDLIKTFPIIQYRTIHITALEELKKLCEIHDDSHILSWLEEKSEKGLFYSLREYHQQSELSKYNKLASLTNTNLPENKSMLWIMMSHQIALAVMSQTDEIKMKHILLALSMISQYEIMYPDKFDESPIHLSIGLLSIFDAKCFAISSIIENNEIPMYKSLRAYMCLGLLNWLIEKIKKHPTDRIPINVVIEIIEKTLCDGLDPIAVKYWTLTSEISKLESLLASNIGNTNKKDGDEMMVEDSTVLLQRLENLRTDKQNFITERVAAPSPIVIFSKASELSCILTDETMKNHFAQLVTDTWKIALS